VSPVAKIRLECPDLLFGSKVEGALRAAGHVLSSEDADVAVVDLTQGEVPEPPMRPALGFYSHVDQDTRRRAEELGYDLVVPRSRMAREAASLVEGLL
jgi:hypothetical protein